jgi:hypothetical protein
MSKTKVYATLNNPIRVASGDTLKQLRVQVDYQKAGWSILSGDRSESGVYVYLTPCNNINGIIQQCITGETHTNGYKILLKQINRKSQKQIDIAADLIIPHAQEIADYYSDYKHQTVYNFIKELYNSNTK